MIRPRSLVTLAAAAVLGLAACQSDAHVSAPADAEEAPTAAAETRRIGKIDWYLDYDAALAVARQENKALWVHFGEDPG